MTASNLLHKMGYAIGYILLAMAIMMLLAMNAAF
jgi:hypothetical protein